MSCASVVFVPDLRRKVRAFGTACVFRNDISLQFRLDIWKGCSELYTLTVRIK